MYQLAWVICIAAALSISACTEEPQAGSRELERAQALLAAEDYEAAFREYSRIESRTGDPLAQFTLGLFHKLGWGRPKDPAKACDWFEKAAEGRVPTAQFYLAEALLDGVYRPEDPVRAAALLEDASAGGHFQSNVTLAELYLSGKGVNPDPKKALALCRDAADRGVVSAQVRAGKLLLEGERVPRDAVAAGQYFQRAAEQDDPEAQFYLGTMLRDGVGTQRSPLAARAWFEHAASHGYIDACLPVGELYLGDGSADPTEEELAKAYLWLSVAVQREQSTSGRARAIELRDRVLKTMPESWRSGLDLKVHQYLDGHGHAGH
jgi:TPR repeat protein